MLDDFLKLLTTFKENVINLAFSEVHLLDIRLGSLHDVQKSTLGNLNGVGRLSSDEDVIIATRLCSRRHIAVDVRQDGW